MAETGLEIAVIGLSGRFPGARNVREFWENLKNGVESLCFFSGDELEEAGIDPQLIEDPNYVKSGGGILDDPDHFDASFFDYTPNEALVMHPQARIFHECAWEALENAGYAPGSFKGKIGIYAGAGSSSRWETLTAMSGKDIEIGRFASASLSNKDFLSTRIAYKLNLKGPGFIMQTACSTSLVAVDLACRGIWTGQCDMALAGGVSVTGNRSTSNPRGYLYREGLISSPDGHCRAFDAKAKGTANGEGAGVVVLKLLENAVSDGDTVYAVIKGSAVNNDGNRKVGFTAPSVEGQAEVIRTAHMMAEVSPETVSYIEAHGTGTSLGDPVEIEALKQGFGTDKKGFCRIGAVKTNVGHLDAAAGIAGLIKTVLALKYRQIPPSLHFETPNPGIDFDNSPFRVCTALTPWENAPHPRRAGVSSFGIGGTNAHVVLEEWPDPRSSEVKGAVRDREKEYHLLLLSAKTETALDNMTRNLVAHLKEDTAGDNLSDVAYTLQVGRNAFGHRKMLVCSTVGEAVDILSTPGSEKVFYYPAKKKSPPVIFMFPGQGSQYVRMGFDLYRHLDTFRCEMDRCFKILAPLMKDDLKEMLYPNLRTPPIGSPRRGVNQTEIAQPLIFAVEYALAKVLMGWGIQPYTMIGHSIGEYVAAHLSGVFSLEDALKIVTLRGKLMQRLPSGTMLGVSLSPGELEPLLESYPALSLAAVNSPSNCTVSGPHEAAAEFERFMQAKGHPCRRLHTSHAFHSEMMDPVLKPFEDELRRISLHKPSIPYLSNVTGKWMTDADAVDPAYWATHLRRTVRFADGIGQVINKMDAIFLEVGPGRVLSTFVTKWAVPTAPGFLALNLVRHPDEDVSDLYFLYREIGRMWLYGREIQWPLFHKNGHRIPLPTYPFERLPFRIDQSGILSDRNRRGLLPGQRPPLDDWFYLPDWKRSVLTRGIASHGEKSRWLVFLDACGFGNRLVSRLQALGHTAATVTPGTEFSAAGQDGNSYSINPRRPGDYLQLFRHLAAQGDVPHRLLHLWSLTGSGANGTGEPDFRENFEEVQYAGYYSLLNIAGAVGKTGTGTSRSFRLDVITDNLFDAGGQENVIPEKSTMMGALTVIPQEHPNIRCRVVDILLPGEELPGDSRWEMPVKQLLEEILTETETVDFATAYRGPHRLVRHFEPLPLKAVKGDAEKNLPIKEKGVYLITGGLGKIGLTLAQYFARDYRARLVLVDRTETPDEKGAQKLAELRELGAEVLTFGVDIADEEQMRTVLHEVEQRWGAVNGVIHCAGILRGKSFELAASLDPAMCMEQFRPKVYGALVLEKLFLDRSLDFCWFMSSVSAILGGLRFSAYSAANASMDALVSRAKRRTETGMNWLSVDWDGLTPKENVDAFKRILSLPLHHVDRVVVSSGGGLQDRIDKWVKLETVEEKAGKQEEKAAALHPRPQLFNPYVEPSTGTQRALAGTWQRIFGFDRVGIRDDFFQLGGDSLKAVTVIAAIHKQLAVEIPLPVFFTNPTVEKLAEYIDRTGTGTYTGIPPAEKKEYYPLSPAQLRLFILQQMDTESTAYNEMQWTAFEGSVDPAAIRDIFARLIRRHDIYRTSIMLVEGEPVQRVHPQVDFELQLSDVSTGGEDTAKHVGRAIAAFRKPFDTEAPPLLRALLVKTGEQRHILVIDQHHLVTDGISHLIFMKETAALYEGKELPPLRLQYKDYAEWVNSPRQQSAMQKQEMYWLEQFRGDIPVLELPLDYPRPAVRSFEGRSVGFSLTEGETRGLHVLAAQEDATFYMALLSIVNVLVAKLSGREDIVLGTVVAGRRHEELRDIIGMFVNTLALRNRPSGELPFATFLKEVKANTLDAFENQEYPFELLVEKADVIKDTSRNPLFDVMFVQQTQAEKNNNGKTAETPGLSTDGIRAVKFDLTLEGIETDGGLKFKLLYSSRLFKEETAVRFTGYFKRIVAAVLENPFVKIADIDVISDEEKQRILVEFNRTESAYPVDSTIHAMFEDMARRVPDSVALVKGDEQLTYRALDETSDRRAHELQEKSVEAGDIAAVLMPRSIELIAALLGILKVGAAYLPIDPGYPEERIRYMFNDSGAKTLLKSEIRNPKSETNSNDRNSNDQNKTNLPLVSDLSSSNFAYVIYTSGTTGRPKGVPVPHRGFINLVHYHREVFGEGPGSRMSQVANPGFDAMAIEVWPCLLSGAALYIADEETRPDPVKMKGWLIQMGITISFQSTVMAEQLLDEPWPESGVALTALYTGGDRLTRYPAHPYPFKLYNLYGPTEDTVWTTWTEVPVTPEAKGFPPIGKPVANHRIYITGPNMEIQPIGVPGELCITGAGLAPGYLNNPELTAEKFFAFNRTYRTYILYKTGDLARWLADGNLEFMGRIDNQVKLRGFRIETGEIEQRLLSHENVKEAVVVLKKDNRRTREYLCAYIVPVNHFSETSELREYLDAALPAYMIPSFFVQLEKIPLTPNGKIDRRALPEPEIGSAEQYIAPRDEVEKELTEIWAGVLGIEKEAVGIDANFFDLGGHSLSIIKMNALLKERLNKTIPVVTLFRLSTVRTLAAYIREEEISLQVADEILEDSVETMDETLSLLMEAGDE